MIRSHQEWRQTGPAAYLLPFTLSGLLSGSPSMISPFDTIMWTKCVRDGLTSVSPAEESSITPGRGEAKRLEEQLRQKGESGTNVCTVFRTLVDANGLSDISGMFFRSSLSSSGGRQNFSGIKKPNCTLYCSDTLREMLWCNITYNTIECPSWCTAGDTHWSNALSLMRRYELFSDWSNLRADWLNKADPNHVFIFCLLFVMMISLSLAQISVGSDVTETGGLPRSSLLGAV